MSAIEVLEQEPSLLGQEERERIRLEETIRYEAREEARQRLEPRKTVWQSFRGFLNSAFGLWMLSTVVLGYGTFKYRELQERDTRRREADRLEFELRHRLSHFRKVTANLARQVHDTAEQGNDPWGHKFASRLRDGYRQIQTADCAFFSTYANDNVQTLFTSLQDKLRGLDEGKAVRIDDCLSEMKELRKRCEDDYNNVPRPDSPETHRAYFEYLNWMIDDVLKRLDSAPLSIWAGDVPAVAVRK